MKAEYLHRSSVIAGLLAVAFFAVVGLAATEISRAATYAASKEAESGVLTGNQAPGDPNGASASASVRFGGNTTGTVRMHYAGNSNFDSSGNYTPGTVGFNLADVGSVSEINSLPAGVKGLAWVGQCNGADANFISTVQPYMGNSRLYGFYLMDEPDPTGQWKTACPIANLKAESDWIHANISGAKTFIIALNMASSGSPTYAGTYNPANSDIDLFGLDPYPCRTELNGCDYTYITKGVAAAEAFGISQPTIVPVYQTFGLGNWVDDGGSTYAVPTVAQEQQILNTWASVVPNPAFDYAYSWGSQNGDTALDSLSGLQQLFATHNTN